jgi:hypothetical protein
VSHANEYKGMIRVFLSMSHAQFWIEIPLIYIKREMTVSVKSGVDVKAKYAPFISFFDDKGNYKLSPYLDDAYKANPNQFEKDFIETDKKVNLMESALSGRILKIFPYSNDANNKWVSLVKLDQKEWIYKGVFYPCTLVL